MLAWASVRECPHGCQTYGVDGFPQSAYCFAWVVASFSSDLLGRVVRRARVEEHVGDDERTLLRVELSFEEGSPVVLGTSADGASLTRQTVNLRTYEMPPYGSVEVSESGVVAERLPPGAAITGVSELVDDFGMTFGIALTTSHSKELYVYTVGDELYASAVLPAEIEALLAH